MRLERECEGGDQSEETWRELNRNREELEDIPEPFEDSTILENRREELKVCRAGAPMLHF